MVNSERPEELTAKRIIEHVLSMDLSHADSHGQVDYLSEDGTTAVEVTTATTADQKRNLHIAGGLMKSPPAADPVTRCWNVVIDSGSPTLDRKVLSRVKPHLLVLESAGNLEFNKWSASTVSPAGGSLAAARSALIDEGVEHAFALDDEANSDPDHEHVLHISTTFGGATDGSNGSLAGVEQELSTRPDNVRKLKAAARKRSHIFVWVDSESDFAIARPLINAGTEDNMGGFPTPNRAPRVDEAVTDLWMVHRSTERGWYWNGTVWSVVSGMTPIS